MDQINALKQSTGRNLIDVRTRLPDVMRQPRMTADARWRANQNAMTIWRYDRGMPVSVNLKAVHLRKLAGLARSEPEETAEMGLSRLPGVADCKGNVDARSDV